MSKLQKRSPMFVVLSLVVTFALLIQVNLARAEEAEGILPSQGIDFINLLAGQNQTIDTSQVTSTGSHSVSIISIGNKTLTALLTMSTKNVEGFWWIFILGTSSVNGIDFAIGLATPSGGGTAQVNLDQFIGWGLAIGGVNATSPVSAADPIKYTIRVTGGAI